MLRQRGGVFLPVIIALCCDCKWHECEATESRPTFTKVQVLRSKPVGNNAHLVRCRVAARDSHGVGSFYLLKATSLNVDDHYPMGKTMCKRYYPLQSPSTDTHVDFIVKNHQWPGGDMSRFLGNLQNGQAIEISGPTNRDDVEELLENETMVGLICGGSGAIVGLQTLRYLEEQIRNNEVQVHLIISDKSQEDIIYDKEFRKFSHEYPNNVFIHRTLTRDAPKGWNQQVGRISKEMIGEHVPEECGVVFVSGPGDFVEHMHSLIDKPLFIL